MGLQNSTEEFAYVDGGSLISLSSSTPIPDQLKKDFLDSTLYAQVNASSFYDRQTSPTGWYNRYLSSLEHIGWNLTRSGFSIITPSGIVNWKRIIETALDKELNQAEVTSLDFALSSFLHVPAYNGSVKAFNFFSSKGDVSTFQVIPAFLNKGRLVATFGLFTIIGIEQKAVSYQTKATGVIHSICVGILSEEVYNKYRNLVQAELSGKPEEYIYALQLHK